MVLESLQTPFTAESNPKKMIIYGFLYMSVAMFLSNMIFRSESSLVMIFLVTMACIPLMYNTILREESKDLEGLGEMWLLKEHWKALSFFIWLFVGVTLATTFWYVVLPAEKLATLFTTQSNALNSISAGITSAVTFQQQMSDFNIIFFNNLKVLIFCVLFSFVYGAGAIFILNWNASVVGVAIGNFVRANIATFADLAGLEKIGAYFSVISIGLLRYIIHGFPEILSYFTAGLAGGIISVAVIKHDYKTRKFEHILLDSADLLLISLGLVFLAGVLEVFVTPLIFG